MTTSPEFDNTQAIPEGWLINERSDAPPYAIEKLDDPTEFITSGNDGKTSFGSDQEAYAFVRRKAEEGSAYHQSALTWLKEHSPEGYEWVMGRAA